MKLLVGLGNPGDKYIGNRHNVGFMFADFMAKKLSAPPFKHDKYCNGELSFARRSRVGHDEGGDLIIVKPQTFMNRSGHTVRELLKKNKDIHAGDVLVAHDDLDIPLGKFKIQKGTGPKLHNGLESIEQAIGTKDFYRIRIGVENRGDSKIPGEAYVLQNFKEDEVKIIETTFLEIYNRLNATPELS